MGVKLENGLYSVDVTLSGGSGRASVQSPTALVVADGKLTALVVWSSSNYDLMQLDGKDFLPLKASEMSSEVLTIAPKEAGKNSSFMLPVQELDQAIEVKARTQAMSQAHLLDYRLTFHNAALKKAVGQARLPWNAISAGLLIVAAGLAVAAYMYKRRKKSGVAAK